MHDDQDTITAEDVQQVEAAADAMYATWQRAVPKMQYVAPEIEGVEDMLRAARLLSRDGEGPKEIRRLYEEAPRIFRLLSEIASDYHNAATLLIQATRDEARRIEEEVVAHVDGQLE